jgi:hypothetical protein
MTRLESHKKTKLAPVGGSVPPEGLAASDNSAERPRHAARDDRDDPVDALEPLETLHKLLPVSDARYALALLRTAVGWWVAFNRRLSLEIKVDVSKLLYIFWRIGYTHGN